MGNASPLWTFPGTLQEGHLCQKGAEVELNLFGFRSYPCIVPTRDFGSHLGHLYIIDVIEF